MGYKLRSIQIKLLSLFRKSIWTLQYLKDYRYENSLFSPIEINNLLTIQEGAIGDTYNFLGALNEFYNEHPYVNIYCLTNNPSCYKNPELKVITSQTAEEMIKERKIDTLLSYGNINHFFKNKKIVKQIFYRKGRPCPFKTRNVPEELEIIFRKLKHPIDKFTFYYITLLDTFYKSDNPLIFIHINNARNTKAINENKIPASLWDLNNWRELSKELIKRYNCILVFTGIESDKSIIDKVIDGLENTINIAGRYNIEETVNLVSKGDLIIGVDSGIIHSFAQTNVPLIILYGGYNSKTAGTSGNYLSLGSEKGCNNCRKYYCPEENPICINSVKVKDILNASEKLLENG